jgi:sporulation protein YlmC with PRC-barrel domain
MSGITLAATIVGLSALLGAGQAPKGPPSVCLSRDLVGMKVVSPLGDDLGKIEDVVVHPGGETSYVVLSFGGWMGMGDKLFAMPWSVLERVERGATAKDGERSLVLPLDKERLKSAPGFDKSKWPAMANADWTRDIDAFYLGAADPNATKPVEAAARTSVITWKLSDLEGAPVENSGGEKVGDIKGLAIDAHGRVNYAVLSVGGFLGIGDRLIAVPWDAMKFSLTGDKGDTKVITLSATKEQLAKAPEFKNGKDDRAAMCDEAWITRVHEYFSCPPYWKAGASSKGVGSAQ